MSDQHEAFMREALAAAELGLARGELPIGAVVVLGDDVIARACTGEVETGRFLVHAEIRALEMADRLIPFPGRRRDVTLYTTLEPCMMCLGAAMSFFLGEIRYALESPHDGAVWLGRLFEERPSPPESIPGYRLPRVEGGLLRAESLDLMRRYLDATPPGGQMWKFAASLVALAAPKIHS